LGPPLMSKSVALLFSEHTSRAASKGPLFMPWSFHACGGA
jgi:hypothetical protein